MKTRLLIIGIIGVSIFGLIHTDSAFALPFISSEHSYENAKYVIVGKILSVEILSEPYVQNSTGIYSQRFGFALYEIQVEEFLKNPINNSTMKVLGKYTNEQQTMSYVTFPYEVNQRVLLYIQEINEIPDYDLIITAANSRVIPEELVPEPAPVCNLGTILKNDACVNAIGLVCGEGTTYQDGICVVDQTENVNSKSSDKWGNPYNAPPVSFDEPSHLIPNPNPNAQTQGGIILIIMFSGIIGCFIALIVIWKRKK